MAILGQDHHAHEQHVKYHGREPVSVFHDMLDTARRLRSWARARGASVLSLTPLLGSQPQVEYEKLRAELGVDRLPDPEDTSNLRWYEGPQEKF